MPPAFRSICPGNQWTTYGLERKNGRFGTRLRIVRPELRDRVRVDVFTPRFHDSNRGHVGHSSLGWLSRSCTGSAGSACCRGENAVDPDRDQWGCQAASGRYAHFAARPVSQTAKRVTTIEGIAKEGRLHQVQQAFLDNDGFQGDYCTPGQIISAVALLDEAGRDAASFVKSDLRSVHHHQLTDMEIRARMSGNICRCGAYPGIVAALRKAHGSTPDQVMAATRGEDHAAL
jgi:aerobic-type carbon monoxide dehydrogenase small subunit (CoxS/CutS family)